MHKTYIFSHLHSKHKVVFSRIYKESINLQSRVQSNKYITKRKHVQQNHYAGKIYLVYPVRNPLSCLQSTDHIQGLPFINVEFFKKRDKLGNCCYAQGKHRIFKRGTLQFLRAQLVLITSLKKHHNIFTLIVQAYLQHNYCHFNKCSGALHMPFQDQSGGISSPSSCYHRRLCFTFPFINVSFSTLQTVRRAWKNKT